MNSGLLVEGDMALAGPAGTFRLLGRGTHLVLDATGVRLLPLVRMGFRARERRGLRSLARALETRRLRVDVERDGRTAFSLGFGCRGGFLSQLLGGAAVAWRARVNVLVTDTTGSGQAACGPRGDS